MKKTAFSRIITLVLIFVMVVTILPKEAIAHSNENHPVTNSGILYDFSSLHISNNNYILEQKWLSPHWH